MATSPLMFDDLPEVLDSSEPVLMFDDLPGQEQAPQPVPEPVLSFDDLPAEAPQTAPAPVSAPAPTPTRDFSEDVVAASQGLTASAPGGIPVPMGRAQGAESEAYLDAVQRSQAGRAALAAFAKANALNPQPPEVIKAFKNRIAAQYPDIGRGRNYDSFFDETMAYYKANPNATSIPGTSAEDFEGLVFENEADSALMTGAKEAVRNLPGLAGGIALGAQGARMGAPFGPAGTVLGGLGGGLIGGLTGQGVADAVVLNTMDPETLRSLGMSPEQLAINAEENPMAAFIGGQAPGLIALRPASGVGQAFSHAAGAGIGAGTEAAIQGVESLTSGENQFSLPKIVGGAVAGAVMNAPTRFGSKYLGLDMTPFTPESYAGRTMSEHITYDPAIVKGAVSKALGDGKSTDEIVTTGPVLDTPENRTAIEAARAAREAGDFSGSKAALDTLAIRKNNGLDVGTATQYINESIQSFKNVPDVQVHASPTADTVPAHLDAKEGTLGAFDKDTGEVHIFADQLVDKADAAAVAYHEILGHAGLSWKFQDDLDNLLINMFQHGNSNFRRAVQDWQRDNPSAYSHITDPKRKLAAQIEEVLADKSSEGPLYRSLYDRVAGLVKDTARKAGADQIKYSDREIKAILATGHDNIINGGDRSLGLGGVRYIYAGVTAQNADLNQFNQARKMIDSGADPEAVRRMTGWHKGDDGGWRYEIDDSTFVINLGVWDELAKGPESGLRADTRSVKADEIIDHPELFEAYPQLRNLNVQVKPDIWDFTRSTQGWYDRKNNLLVITPYVQDLRGTAIHELQHAVQDIEGFAPGGDPDTAMSSVSDDVALSALPMMSEYVSRQARQIENKILAFVSAEADPDFQEMMRLRKAANEAWSLYDGNREAPNADALRDAWDVVYREAGRFERDLRNRLIGENPSSADRSQFSDIAWFLSKSQEGRENELLSLTASQQKLKDTEVELTAAAGDADAARAALSKVEGANFMAYQALHGEVEARDTSLRLGLDASERAMIKPMSMEGEVLPNEYVFADRGFSSDTRSQSSSQAPDLDVDVSYIRQEDWDGNGYREFKLPRSGERGLVYDDGQVLIEDGAGNWRNPTLAEASVIREFARNEPPAGDAVKTLVPRQSQSVMQATRKVRNPGFSKDTEAWLDRHLSPHITDGLHGRIKDFDPKTRRPDVEVISEALDYGIDVQSAREFGPMADNSAYIVALGDQMNELARKVVEKSRFLDTQTKISDADEADLLKTILDFSEIANLFRGAGTATGRMLRAFRIKIDELGEDFSGLQEVIDGTFGNEGGGGGLDIREMVRRIANGDSKQLLREADKLNPDWKKFAMSLYYNGLLGNFSTHWANLKGNTSMLFGGLMGDVGAAISGTARGLGTDAERMTWTEVGRRWKGMALALNPDTLRAVVREFTAPVGSAHTNKWQAQSIPHLGASLVIEHSTRALQAADAFFRALHESSNMYGLAYREAAREAQTQLGGRFGDSAHKQYIEARIPQIMDAPTEAMLKEIQRATDEGVFQTKLSENIRKLGGLRDFEVGGFPVGRFVLPIMTAPTNIIRQAAGLTGTPAAYKLAKGEGKGADLDRLLAKASMGLLFTAYAGMKAWNNEITGMGPSDPNERAQWLVSNKPQSIKIGDEWYSFKSVDPFATHLTVMADTLQQVKRNKNKMDAKGDNSVINLMSGVSGAFLSAVMSNSFMDGLSLVGDSSDNVFEKILLNAAAPLSHSPLLSAHAVASDEYQRDMGADDFTGKIENRFQSRDSSLAPVWSKGGREALPIRVDALGRPLKREHEPVKNEVTNELGRLFDNTGEVVIGIPESRPYGRYIPREIYHAHNLIVGPEIEKRLQVVMKSPSYGKMNDPQRVQILKKVVSATRKEFKPLLNKEMLRADPKYGRAMIPNLKEAFIPED